MAMGGYESNNWGWANITQFGPGAEYTITTDKCEDGNSRSPLSYSVSLCVGDGTECNSTNPWAVCGAPGASDNFRPFCAVTEPLGGNPKAVALNDTTAWSCQVCPGSSNTCVWS
ncbi:hypothetical protein CGRA01v4_15055 [Colletotrichum graminicola]|nr:hypothetical protein CGRA01v4_15055 [Colletotrichum graminicola]